MSKVKIDLSAIDDLKKTLLDAHNKSVKVGWFSDAKYQDGLPVATVAHWQEYGTSTIPPRPFFRPTISDKKDDWSKLVNDGFLAVMNGNTSIDNVLDAVGLTVAADVKNSIANQSLALSPVTLALRRLRDDGYKINKWTVLSVASAIKSGKTGSGQLGEPSKNKSPLRDTGVMLATITHEKGE